MVINQLFNEFNKLPFGNKGWRLHDKCEAGKTNTSIIKAIQEGVPLGGGWTWGQKDYIPGPLGSDGYVFQGFLTNPDVIAMTDSRGYIAISPDYWDTMTEGFDEDVFVPHEAWKSKGALTAAEFKARIKEQLEQRGLSGDKGGESVAKQQLVQLDKTRGMDLLSPNTYVESPFIIAKIGNYTFGSYVKEGDIHKLDSTMTVDYPNYMDSINITKINGAVNSYTLNMIYQIAPGQDPNLLDKILGSVAGSREISLTYGDWSLPNNIYREEKAIITKVSSKVDFMNQRITYTLTCLSRALLAASQTFPFPAYTIPTKGSDIIKEVLYNPTYGLLEVFPGMKNQQLVDDAGLIKSDDKLITVEAIESNPLDYINYIIASMVADTNSDDDIIKDSTYHLVISDDIENDFGGEYFRVVKIGTTTRNLTSQDIYEVDVGFGNNGTSIDGNVSFAQSTLVTDFQLASDNSWEILYNYSEKVSTNKYKYKIDNNGELLAVPTLSLAESAQYNRVTNFDKTWWTRMTQFPIKATLTIKGLLRPAILMNYVRVNTYFYGQKHISSGLYIITKQEDSINQNGYRTVLTLTRIAGDDDEIYKS